jgi:AAA ATPase domain
MLMDPLLNPYAPGAGTPPPELTGRQDLLERTRVALGRTKLRRYAKSFIAVGLRGVGKTVLLRETLRLAAQDDFHICYVEAHEHKHLAELLAPPLRSVLLELDRLGRLSAEVKRGLRVLKSFLSAGKVTYGDAELALDIDSEPGTADTGNLDIDLPDLLAAVGRAANARNSQVVVIIDELQYLGARDFGALITALHRCVQEQLPVLLIAAGLPHLVGLAGQAKSYAERMFDFPEMGALSKDDADLAIVMPAQAQDVDVTPDALDTIYETTMGYPYFLQEWAYHAWNVSPGPVISRDDVQAAAKRAEQQLDASFFRVRFDRLTNREKHYLRAMASLDGPTATASEIAAVLGVKAQSLAPMRSGLIIKGMIYAPSRGGTAFTVPMFDDFLRRSMPDWAPPAARS